MLRSATSGYIEVGSSISSNRDRLPVGFRLGLVVWGVILLLGSLLIRGGEAVNTVIDIDEFHFLHSAWMVGHGYLPYRDFWTNHSPLFIYLLKPLVALYDENLALFTVARLLMLVITLALFGLVAAIAGRQKRWTAGLFAVLLVSVNLVTFMVTVTVRHDSLTVICELLALMLLARGVRSDRPRELLAAGGALGLALALSPKGLFALGGLMLGCLVHHVTSSPGAERGRALVLASRQIGMLLGGSVGTFGLVVGSLVPLDIWPIMVERVFVESLLSPERFSPLTVYLLRYVKAEPIIWLVLVGGYAVAAWEWRIEPLRRDPLETLLLVTGLWCGVTYLFLMSSPYPQSALPFLAIGSIFGGRLLAMGEGRMTGVTSKAKRGAWVICLAGLIGWIAVGSAWTVFQEHSPFRRMNGHQLQMIEYVLSLTDREDAVFDADAAYVFRPQASYYGSLMSTIRMRIQRGELEFDIPERCERFACKVVITGSRVVRLPQKVQAWIRDNYTSSLLFPRVLLHNSLVSGEGGSGGQPRRVNGRR